MTNFEFSRHTWFLEVKIATRISFKSSRPDKYCVLKNGDGMSKGTGIRFIRTKLISRTRRLFYSYSKKVLLSVSRGPIRFHFFRPPTRFLCRRGTISEAFLLPVDRNFFHLTSQPQTNPNYVRRPAGPLAERWYLPFCWFTFIES